jgi:glucans biosynthesis protein C
VQHLSVTYGASGSWMYTDPATDTFTSTFLSVYNLIPMAAGMGFFFLLAGYFTPGSYDRKGAASFLRDPLVRLGIPWLLYDLLLAPLVVYIAGGLHGSYWSFYGDYLLHVRTISPGPVWFIKALLLFTFLYAAWRGVSRHRPHAAARAWKLPSKRRIYGFIFALALVSFVVRIWWPIGWWFQPFSLELALFPQYISLYILGLIASRHNWFFELSARMGKVWLWTALIATAINALCWAIPSMTMPVGWGMVHQMNYFFGGFHWQALVWAVWEAFLVVGVCLGLLALFRQHWNRQGRLTKGLAANTYTVYLIHSLVLVSFASAFHTVALYPQRTA